MAIEEQILAQIRDLIGAGDLAGARAMIESVGSPDEIAERYKKVLLDQYWKAKNVAGVVAMGRSGIAFCMDHRVDLRSCAKELAYNLGSFIWPGWAMAEFRIGEADLKVGAEAAKLNFRLAVELNRPAVGMANAHWLVGAQALAAGEGKSAAEAFGQALALVPADMRALHRGYIAIAALMDNPGDSASLGGLRTLLASLEGEGGAGESGFIAEQLLTAAGVFLKDSVIGAINNRLPAE